MKRRGRKYLAIITVLMFLVSFFPGYSLAEESGDLLPPESELQQSEQIVPDEPSAVEQQTYEIQYLLNDSDGPVPGLESIRGLADVGTTVTVSHPETEGYQVIDDQAAELVISEDAEQNQVIIYYQASEALPTALDDQVSLTVKYVMVLDDGSEELIDTEIIENMDRGTVFPGSDFVKYYDSLEFIGSDPEEITLDKEENDIALFYQEKEQSIIEDNPDGLSEFSTGITKATDFYYPPSLRKVKSMMLNGTGGLTWPNPGAINLTKTAQPVPGSETQWQLTLTIEGKNIQTISDVVLVIDKSTSMNTGSKMANTKLAAKEFVDQLLLPDGATRIAAVSFDGDPHMVADFTDYTGKAALKTAIDSISAGGGTNIQASIRQAQILLAASSATNKIMVLLGDGEPTYSFRVSDASGITLTGHTGWWGQTPVITYDNPQITAINYSERVGSGNSYTLSDTYHYQIPCPTHGSHATTFPANNGIPTIYEAGLAKDAGTKIYAVALQAGTNGQEVLQACQDSGYYPLNSSDLSGLSGAFGEIAGQIAYAASNGVVIDPMGTMFDLVSNESEITVSQGSVTIDPANTINWNTGNIAEGTPATMTYIVQIKDGADANINYPTNQTTTFSYTDVYGEPATSDFEIPQVSIGGGSILMKGYRVNEAGQPINSSGVVVDRPDQAQRLYDNTYSTTPLSYNQTYQVTQSGVTGYQYVKYVWNEATGIAETVDVYLQSSAPTQIVWFGYKELTELPYAVKYYVNNVEQSAWEENGTVPSNSPIVSTVPDKTPVGYSLDTTASTSLPFTVTISEHVISVYYTPNAYTVTWKNYDGSILETDLNVAYGTDPSYDGLTPSKAATAQYSYTFAGWTPTVEAVTGNATYTATFTETTNAYTVTWKNYDGSILETDLNVAYGTDPSYDGAEPSKPATAEFTYTFNGWTPAVSPVTGETTYTATYSAVPNSYTITYVINGSYFTNSSYATASYEYGTPLTAIATPSQTGYTFHGWTGVPAAMPANDVTVTGYFTKNGGGGGGGGSTEETITIEEEPVAIPLNKDDHFAYVAGYPDNTVQPEGNVTREEVAAVFYRLLDATYRDTVKTNTNNFTDVGSDRWSSKHISTLSAIGVIVGYPDGSFRPGSSITRAELATVASNFDKLSPFTSNSYSDITGHWANQYINSAAQKGWVTGYPDGTFKPDQAITRAEFMTLVNNVLERRVLKENILPDAKQFPDLSSEEWYYEEVQEAINSHYYERATQEDYEIWTEIYFPTLDM